jgi:putative DNA primase/helicase
MEVFAAMTGILAHDTTKVNGVFLQHAQEYHAWGANVTAIAHGYKAPHHHWKKWQTEPQTPQDVVSLYDWRKAWGVGIISGVNGWRAFDFDKCANLEPVKQVLAELGLPEDYRWVTMTGSRNGYHIWFRCDDDIPAGTLAQKENEKGVFWGQPRAEDDFDHVELRWASCQTVAPPSSHPSGNEYVYLNGQPTEPPAEVPVDRVLAAFFSVANNPSASRPDVKHSGKVPAGGRNNQLASLAGLMRSKGFNQTAIEAALLEYNVEQCDPPLAEDEVLSIARSISRYEPTANDVTFPWTDLGNAERLVYYHGRDLRYVNAWGKWLVWEDKRWVEDDTGEVNRRANDTVRGILAAASNETDSARCREMAQFALRCESANRLGAMVELAQTLPGVAMRDSQLDADHWLLNVNNGLLDLQTGELRPHDREALCTKLAPVNYDPAAECPTWLAFLDRVMDGNQALISFLQQAVGYSLTGATTEQCLFFLYGTGRNGKSTFIETISRLTGDYARRVPTDVLMSGSRGAMTEMSQLQGVRLTMANETEQGARFAESLIKDLTGGDTVVARRLYQHSYEFRPAFKLWMYGNHKPVIKGTDEGIWRRIRLIPFTVQIPVEEVDRALPAKLLDELPGILNWALEGCRQWLAAGQLEMPEAVSEATDSYRSEMDPFSDFLGEYVLHDPQLKVKSEQLYGAYQGWCSANGETYVSHKEFGRVLRERGYESKKTGKGTFWLKIGLKEEHRNIPQPVRPVFDDMLSN